MNGVINFIIYGLLALSIWALASVGLGIVPLIEVPFLTNDLWTKLNGISINLAYSYFAGFIMFTMTVTIPQYNRKKINLPLIKMYIETYHSNTTFNFFMFSIENPTLEFDETDKKLLDDYRKKLGAQIGEKLLNSFISSRSNELRYSSITSLVESNTKFISEIMPYESILTNVQLATINDVRKNDISLGIEDYKNFIGTKDIDVIIFKSLKEHLKRVEQLNETL